MMKAVLRIDSPDAGTILSALLPEVDRTLPRTKVGIEGDSDTVTLCIEATDTVAMRAALNSYLGCIRITEEISKITR